jgi:undecaprenyl-diphosphatase
MSEWLFAVLLGVIEGVTEFLPVSSTGHLLIAERLAGRHFSDLFNTVIQVGAVLAVVAVFADRVRSLITRWSEPANQDYLLKLAAAFLVTAIGGLALKKAGLEIAQDADSGGLGDPGGWRALRGSGTMAPRAPHHRPDHVGDRLGRGRGSTHRSGLSGASRSGTTILIALALGLSRNAAAEFSFLLGIPTLMAAESQGDPGCPASRRGPRTVVHDRPRRSGGGRDRLRWW